MVQKKYTHTHTHTHALEKSENILACVQHFTCKFTKCTFTLQSCPMTHSTDIFNGSYGLLYWLPEPIHLNFMEYLTSISKIIGDDFSFSVFLYAFYADVAEREGKGERKMVRILLHNEVSFLARQPTN